MKLTIFLFVLFFTFSLVPLFVEDEEVKKYCILIAHLSTLLPAYLLFIEQKYNTLSLVLSATLVQFVSALCETNTLCIGLYEDSIANSKDIFFSFSVLHLFANSVIGKKHLELLQVPLFLVCSITIATKEIQGMILLIGALLSLVGILSRISRYHLEDLAAFVISMGTASLFFFWMKSDHNFIPLFVFFFSLSFAFTIDINKNSRSHFLLMLREKQPYEHIRNDIL